jgi:hypothetical protein
MQHLIVKARINFHQNNVMVVEDPNYFMGLTTYRPVIIDFGRTVKIPPHL